MPEWLTTEDAAEILGYHPETIREMLRVGRLRGRKFGNIWLIYPDSAYQFREKIEEEGFDKNDPRRGKV